SCFLVNRFGARNRFRPRLPYPRDELIEVHSRGRLEEFRVNVDMLWVVRHDFKTKYRVAGSPAWARASSISIIAVDFHPCRRPCRGWAHDPPIDDRMLPLIKRGVRTLPNTLPNTRHNKRFARRLCFPPVRFHPVDADFALRS